MKILLETTYLKQHHYKPLIEKYPNIEFTFDPDPECEILIGVYNDQNQAFFDQFKKLKWIILVSSGFNQLDLTYLRNRNVAVTNGKGIYDIQIAEDVVSKMLYFNRRMDVYHEQMKEHLWKHQAPHYELYQQQALILGAGSIGQTIAQRLKGFDMEVVGYKRHFETLPNFDHIITNEEDLNKYYKTCDYLIISLPLNQHTEKMINEDVLNKLKNDVVIVNIGRGEIIDQEALMIALNEERIRGAGLDVTYPEPLPEDDPLWNAKNIYISPHNSSASPKVQERRMSVVIDLLDKYLNDQPLYNIILKGENHE